MLRGKVGRVGCNPGLEPFGGGALGGEGENLTSNKLKVRLNLTPN